MKLGNSITFRDGRRGVVEDVKINNRLVWVRDENGYLSSADLKTGWSSDGNWRNDIKSSPLPFGAHRDSDRSKK